MNKKRINIIILFLLIIFLTSVFTLCGINLSLKDSDDKAKTEQSKDESEKKDDEKSSKDESGKKDDEKSSAEKNIDKKKDNKENKKEAKKTESGSNSKAVKSDAKHEYKYVKHPAITKKVFVAICMCGEQGLYGDTYQKALDAHARHREKALCGGP